MPHRQARNHRIFWVSFIVSLGVMGLMVHHNVWSLYREIRREGLSSAAVVACRDTLVDVLDVETGLRGYLIRGRKEYLRPYHEGLGRLGRDLAALKSLAGRDPAEGPHVAEVSRLVAEVLAEFAAQLEADEDEGTEAARKRFADFPTKPAVDMIRTHLLAVEVDEARRLVVNTEALDRTTTTTLWTIDLFIFVVFVVLAAMMTGFLRIPVRSAVPAFPHGEGPHVEPR
jgi:CHASE3 domain sensor protein